MKNNKFIIFIAIGFELIGLIIVALWAGDYLTKQGYSKSITAFFVLAAFLIWFISLILKLKKIKND